MAYLTELAKKHVADNQLRGKTPIYSAARFVFRIADMAAGIKLPLAQAYADKYMYNAAREDHSHESRTLTHETTRSSIRT